MAKFGHELFSVALVSFLLTPVVAGGSSSVDDEIGVYRVRAGESTSARCKPGEFLDERLALIVGFASLARSEKGSRSAIRCLITLWPIERQEPGASGVSNGMLAMLLVAPDEFIEEMVPQQQILEDWLRQLSILSFTWSSSRPCKYDVDRERLAALLSGIKDRGEPERVRKRIAQVLRSTSCHYVN